MTDDYTVIIDDFNVIGKSLTIIMSVVVKWF